VLHELRVENLLLIERAELRLAPGLNVLTGETGAGKTVLAHALDRSTVARGRAGARGGHHDGLRPPRGAARQAPGSSFYLRLREKFGRLAA
jgi:ABC-type glutathione transport system ATPase component